MRRWSCFSNQALADLWARCRKWRLRAQCVNWIFLLRALAARKMLQQRKSVRRGSRKNRSFIRAAVEATCSRIKYWSKVLLGLCALKGCSDIQCAESGMFSSLKNKLIGKAIKPSSTVSNKLVGRGYMKSLLVSPKPTILDLPIIDNPRLTNGRRLILDIYSTDKDVSHIST